jgi:PII-like signaling protein
MMQVKVTRVYLNEESPLLNELFDFLQAEKIKGATIYRGVKGFGDSGKTRETRFLDLHFDLPVVLEFFDEPSRVDAILHQFNEKIPAGHLLQWLAEVN